jgi:hypothetical protein
VTWEEDDSKESIPNRHGKGNNVSINEGNVNQ